MVYNKRENHSVFTPLYSCKIYAFIYFMGEVFLMYMYLKQFTYICYTSLCPSTLDYIIACCLAIANIFVINKKKTFFHRSMDKVKLKLRDV